ncbi:kinase-like domain-containing protein [Chaetomium fimeti]|uniref:Kinase-like domain-containing protein n=1 Tax=Chaetomium fimeti TaxID=1854472 RepID=A0AAE0HA61_9PEZI|nr:kinase-like domain-containing protein [Chaetomium fimeti]
MELVPGVTLEDKWPTLDRLERTDVCTQLRTLLTTLRSLRHEPDDEFFLGHVNREPLGDIAFTDGVRPSAGPFQSVAEFHEWMSFQTRIRFEPKFPGKLPWEIIDPWRDGLPDEAAAVFTHADLHPSNIIIANDSSKIVALIDWRQSGWYPEYWEYCKACYTADPYGEWMNEYIPLFLDEPACFDTFEDYARSFGY